MCLIIDANRAAAVFHVPPHEDFWPLLRWLRSRWGKLVYGGQLANELERVRAAKGALAELKRSGRAVLVDMEAVTKEALTIKQLCKSNDPFVVALARLTGARILCTEDRTLIEDFLNRTLVPSPKGKIYMRQEHRTLLGGRDHGHCRGCRGSA